MLLREEENINEYTSIIDKEISTIYLLLVATHGKDSQISETFRIIIQAFRLLSEKYENNFVNTDLISLAYYVILGEIEKLEESIEEDSFLKNESYMEVDEVFRVFIENTDTKLTAIYKRIDAKLQFILSTVDKVFDFMKNNKNEIYRQIIVREKDIQDGKRLFISYTHKDESLVLKIRNRFKLSNLRIWIDEESIKPAEEINEAIKRAIDSADYFLLFDSDNSRESEYVNKEIEYALENYSRLKRPAVIPILINVDKTREDIEGIKYIKGIESDNLDICMNKIFQAIDAKFIAIKVAELNTLLMLMENFIKDVWWCYTADYNMCIYEEMFINFESLEHYLNEKWLLFEEKVDYSYIREDGEGLKFDWDFYNSNRLAIIGAFKIKYVLDLFDAIIKNSDDSLYLKYQSILNQ